MSSAEAMQMDWRNLEFRPVVVSAPVGRPVAGGLKRPDRCGAF
jgi:hypothetical protein